MIKMSVQFMRAVYDFVTHEQDELPLQAGDVVKVTGSVDGNWMRGTINGKSGNFPCNFVEPITLPSVGNGQKLFVAVENFPAQASGDLGFLKGEIIVGTQQVDGNWWQGQRGGVTGIFPVNHVRVLDTAPVMAVPPRPAVRSPRPDHTHTAPSVASTSNTTQASNGVIALARATMDLTAQVDDELSLMTGDIINVTRCIDADFYYGESKGNCGMFPAAFVEIVEGHDQIKAMTSSSASSGETVLSKTTKHFMERTLSQENDTAVSNNVTKIPVESVGVNISGKSSSAENNVNGKVLTNGFNTSTQYSYQEQHKSDVIPANSVDINSGRHEVFDTQISFTAENTWSQESAVSAYARTLFPFIAENDNELTFMDNEIINLICHVDNQWTEGEINGKRGIFPRNYVEIIVDCPYAEQMGEHGKDSKSKVESSVETLDEKYARVLYDFNAASDKDLTVREGETVTIIRKFDENWYEAKLDSGQTGFCPVNYLEIICSEPPDQPVSKQPEVASNQASSGISSVASSVAVKQVTKPKPEIRPRPVISPKPSMTNQSVNTFDKESPNELPKSPAKPKPSTKPIPKARNRSPVFQQQAINDIDLNDVIMGEMNRAKTEAESKSRSNSDADSRKTSTSSMNLNAQSNPQQQYNDEYANRPLPNYDVLRQADPNASAMSQGLSFGQSTFFMGESMTTSTSGKPVPIRPPPAPPGGKHRNTPPPRPRGPSPTKSTSSDSSAQQRKLVPQRAAPPRPSRTPRPATAANPGLMQDANDSDNIEIIKDLEKRIEEVENDLQKYHNSREELESTLTVTGHDQCVQREENLAFCLANIEGLSTELQQLKENLNQLQPNRAIAEAEARKRAQDIERQKEEEMQNKQERIQRNREKREKVIEELLTTEQDFLRNLQLYISTFLSPQAEKHPDVDMDQMFGNIEEVAEVSQKLLLKLEQVQSQDFQAQLIGPCFIDLAEDMRTVYAPYCRNHDDVIKLLEKYEDQPSIQQYFNRGLDALRQHINVFDMGSTLIKPVQRVLKYPLLLNEVLKSTEDDHPDKVHLLNAIHSMTGVATAINEYKRRKDLVLKYRQDTDQSLSERFSKLNLHSIRKKSTRLSQRIVGVQTVDEEFNTMDNRFGSLEKAVSCLVKDISQYLRQVQEAVSLQEIIANDISDFYIEKSSMEEVNKFQKVQNKIATSVYEVFKNKVETSVVKPLSSLLLMFQGPVKVMKKRYDKLLDYESTSSRIKGLRESEITKAVKDELEKSRKDYEALNAQLLDELPKLYHMSVSLVKDCMSVLLTALKAFLTETLDEMYTLLALPLILSGGEGNIVENFNISHSIMVEKLSDLSFIPKAFNPSIEDKKERRKSRMMSEGRPSQQKVDSSAQSDSAKVYLRQKYAPDRVFKVCQVHQLTQPMDVSFPEGTLVGVIKEQDPMGNKERWFVDSGASQGFIASKCLGPVKGPEPAYLDSTDLLCLAGSPPSIAAGETSPPPSYSQTFGTAQPDLVSVCEEKSGMPPDLMSAPPMASVPGTQDFSDRYQSGADNFDSLDLDNTSLPWLQSSNDQQAANQKSEPDTSAYEYYQAVYPFSARSPIEISLTEGQVILVMAKHDLEGNTEWWLVNIDGQQGYAPASYLYKVE